MTAVEQAGRTILLTGAAQGIGAAIAAVLAARGARLFLVDLKTESLREVAAEAQAAGADAEAHVGDIRRWEDADAAARACLDRFGGVDVCIANAAVVEEGAFADADPMHYRDVVETNLIGTINTVRAVAPAMRDAGSGHIVLMSSVSGRETYPGQPVYIATKWGIVGFGRALRKELLHDHIRVTLIEPGLTDTELARSSPLGREFLAGIDALSADDVARAVLYALEQPPHVAVNEVVVQPVAQAI